MSRIRTIKPEFPQSETVGRLSRDARLLFLMLFTICDDSGRARASSRILASLLYPFDDDAFPLMDSWLAELERECCVRRYMVEGNTYLEIINWLKHQKIDRPSVSRIPPFNDTSRGFCEPSRDFASQHRASDADLGSGIVIPMTVDSGDGSGDLTPETPSVPDGRPFVALTVNRTKTHTVTDAELQLVYTAYPRKVGAMKAIEAIRKAVAHLGTGENCPVMTPSEALVFLLDRTKRYAGSNAGRQGEYTPHPATWFNQGRYLDDENEWDNAGQSKGGNHGTVRNGRHSGNNLSDLGNDKANRANEALARAQARILGEDEEAFSDAGFVEDGAEPWRTDGSSQAGGILRRAV